jgi:hypothetical protein
MKRAVLLSLIFVLLFSCKPELVQIGPKYDYSKMEKRIVDIHKELEEFIFNAVTAGDPLKLHPRTRIDSLIIDDRDMSILIDFNKYFSYMPLREDNVTLIYKTIRELAGKKYKNYQLIIRSMEYPIQDLIPNFYRSRKEDHDILRKPLANENRSAQLVRPIRRWSARYGLEGKNIALWHSHGWYYNNSVDRWEWQRPRLFQTVEDLLPMSITLPYLIPMLESAGANVFIPRERDIQINEAAVDNDSSSSDSCRYTELNDREDLHWQTGIDSGFALGAAPYQYGINPFKQGTCRFTYSDSVSSAGISWVPDIPEDGRYAVYISFRSSPDNIEDARYTVLHRGGRSTFLVNQQIGGGTWVYLGTFTFSEGVNADSGNVQLSNISVHKGRIVSADAVRFGGGMGDISRGGSVSGRPRFVEAARYHLQYSGMPDTLVYSRTNNKNDYVDDYQSRPEFVNYLKGAPFGPTKNRQTPGLGIPIDLSLSFHTDAGISPNDTTIGTLAIYSIMGADTQNVFPDSVSRLANRDFTDMLQTQIVDDIRNTIDPDWNRRYIMNADYSEAYRPNVPSALIELLSHQNFGDMQFAQDPRFRFIAARAIYKGMLKFLAVSDNYEYVVQPLPVTHFSAVFDSLGRLALQWKDQDDPLEPTAFASMYNVYVRRGKTDFSLAKIVNKPNAVFNNLAPGVVYSFKVTALNEGGESFPSEILSVCRMPTGKKPVLLVNGFDRISPPAILEAGSCSGFWNVEDQGVPDHYDIGYTGMQHDFNINSGFIINDAPGHGASSADFETTVIPGNTFDFPSVHGEAVKNAGYSFVSCSDEAVMDGLIELQDYDVVDLILGEEKETRWQKFQMDTLLGIPYKTFPQSMQNKIRLFTEDGGNLFVSGAYLGKDMFAGKDKNHADVVFAKEVLHYKLAADHASRSGNVFFNSDSLFISDEKIQFNQNYHSGIYTVEAPDALDPVKDSHTIMRYSDNHFSAAAAHAGSYKTVVMGFPFETIIDKKQRDLLMKMILEFFEKNN